MDFYSYYLDLKGSITPYNIFTTIIGLVGIFASVVSIWISKRHRSPKYMIRNSNIVGETTLDTQLIDIHYQNTAIPVLSVSKIAFWNSGRVTLNSSDMASKDMMRIEVSGENVSILDFKLLYENKRNGIELLLSEDKKSISISFDYFAYRQGFVVKLFHTGLYAQNLSVKGSVKDGRDAKRIDNIFGLEEEDVKKSGVIHLKNRSLLLKQILGWVYFVLGFLMIVFRIIRWDAVSTVPSVWSKLAIIISGLVTMGLGYLFAHRPLPRKLAKAFYDE